MKTSFKTGDTVKILSGDEKGKQGKVLKVDRDNGRVLVEGINLMTHYTRKSEKNPQGGMNKREATLHISKVMKVEGAHHDKKETKKETKKASKK